MTLIVSFEIIFILLFTLSVRIFILYKRCFTRCTRRVFLRNRSTALYIRNTILNTRKCYSQYEKYYSNGDNCSTAQRIESDG